jgi:hypothetical protein
MSVFESAQTASEKRWQTMKLTVDPQSFGGGDCLPRAPGLFVFVASHLILAGDPMMLSCASDMMVKQNDFLKVKSLNSSLGESFLAFRALW